MLTQARLKGLLHYNPETGVFTRLVGSGSKRAGDISGSLMLNGYLSICILSKKNLLAHRLAFLYMEGALPPNQVDHINRDRADNRWTNLRHATSKENNRNTVNNVSFIGVNWDKRHGKWKAIAARKEGKSRHLGNFKTHLAACYARHIYNLTVGD